MPLSWNEIRDRALKFSREWADESSEDAEAKTFWDGFFNVFGVPRMLNVREVSTRTWICALSKALGTTPGTWYAMQHNYNMWHAQRRLRAKIKPLFAKTA